MKTKNDKPASKEKWLKEIVEAYFDAAEAIPFGPMAGVDLKERELFHLAPSVCIKFRGLKNTKKILERATEAALSTCVATDDIPGNIMENPVMAFALCYITSHYGLGIIDEIEANDVINYLEEHQNELSKLIKPNKAI